MARHGGTLERQHVGDEADEVEPPGPASGLEEGDDEDWLTLWSCACGYGNLGTPRCLRCGKRAPAEAREAGGLWMGEYRVAATPSKGAGRKAWRTVFATIGLNLVVQAVVAGFVIAGNVGLADSVKISLLTGLGYYTAVALWILCRSLELGLRPQTGRSTALVGAAEGFVVGGGLALLLVAGLRLATGHPVLDPTTAVLAGQSSIAPLVIGFFMVAIFGPVVEELVFRGFLAEAFRNRGRRTAVWISAVGFSLAHLRLSQFRYYVAMGVVFGFVYWRRGLVGSVAAHAAFNGMLIVVAVAAIHGPVQHVATDDFEATIPPAWVVTESPMGDELVADSPLGSRVELLHMEAAGIPDVSVLARGIGGGGISLPPGITVDAATVAIVDFPSGQGLVMSVDVEGYDGRVVMIPKADRLWVATLQSGGEERDVTAFHDIVASWRF